MVSAVYMCAQKGIFMVLAYEFTWPEELNVIGYACAKFNFHFVNFIRKVVHIQKMLCIDEMIILRWTLTL